MNIERICTIEGSKLELKALQIMLENGPFLALGYLNHGDLLDSFLNQNHIPFEVMPLADHRYGHRSVHAMLTNELTDVYYAVVGMGLASHGDSEIILSGKSIGYNIYPNRRHIDELNTYLNGITVRVE